MMSTNEPSSKSSRSVCFIPGCLSGYISDIKYRKRRGQRIPNLFSAPKDPALLQVWQNVIPRTDRLLSSKDKVCELHFARDNILKHYQTVLSDGSIDTSQKLDPILKPGSIPCKFPGFSKGRLNYKGLLILPTAENKLSSETLPKKTKDGSKAPAEIVRTKVNSPSIKTSPIKSNEGESSVEPEAEVEITRIEFAKRGNISQPTIKTIERPIDSIQIDTSSPNVGKITKKNEVANESNVLKSTETIEIVEIETVPITPRKEVNNKRMSNKRKANGEIVDWKNSDLKSLFETLTKDKEKATTETMNEQTKSVRNLTQNQKDGKKKKNVDTAAGQNIKVENLLQNLNDSKKKTNTEIKVARNLDLETLLRNFKDSKNKSHVKIVVKKNKEVESLLEDLRNSSMGKKISVKTIDENKDVESLLNILKDTNNKQSITNLSEENNDSLSSFLRLNNSKDVSAVETGIKKSSFQNLKPNNTKANTDVLIEKNGNDSGNSFRNLKDGKQKPNVRIVVTNKNVESMFDNPKQYGRPKTNDEAKLQKNEDSAKPLHYFHDDTRKNKIGIATPARTVPRILKASKRISNVGSPLRKRHREVERLLKDLTDSNFGKTVNIVGIGKTIEENKNFESSSKNLKDNNENLKVESVADKNKADDANLFEDLKKSLDVIRTPHEKWSGTFIPATKEIVFAEWNECYTPIKKIVINEDLTFKALFGNKEIDVESGYKEIREFGELERVLRLATKMTACHGIGLDKLDTCEVVVPPLKPGQKSLSRRYCSSCVNSGRGENVKRNVDIGINRKNRLIQLKKLLKAERRKNSGLQKKVNELKNKVDEATEKCILVEKEAMEECRKLISLSKRCK